MKLSRKAKIMNTELDKRIEAFSKTLDVQMKELKTINAIISLRRDFGINPLAIFRAIANYTLSKKFILNIPNFEKGGITNTCRN